MRIVDIRETAVPLKSTLANSSFDFSEMTTSVVAVITDVVRNGNPICGFAFNSTGRYACGAQMRARFIPRILAAEPASLLDETGNNLDPAKIFACMMRREKAGGHSERSIAIGTIEVALWDAVAKIADKPLHVLLAERFNGGRVTQKVYCYVGAGERVAVDANCKLERDGALAYGRALAPLKLRWFEEQSDPLDYELFAEL